MNLLNATIIFCISIVYSLMYDIIINKIIYKVPLNAIRDERIKSIKVRLKHVIIKIYKLELNTLMYNKIKSKNDNKIAKLKDIKENLELELSYLRSYNRTYPINHKKED